MLATAATQGCWQGLQLDQVKSNSRLAAQLTWVADVMET